MNLEAAPWSATSAARASSNAPRRERSGQGGVADSAAPKAEVSSTPSAENGVPMRSLSMWRARLSAVDELMRACLAGELHAERVTGRGPARARVERATSARTESRRVVRPSRDRRLPRSVRKLAARGVVEPRSNVARSCFPQIAPATRPPEGRSKITQTISLCASALPTHRVRGHHTPTYTGPGL